MALAYPEAPHLALHEKVILGGAPIYSELSHWLSHIHCHRLEDIVDLERNALEHGTHDVRTARELRQADESTTRIIAPMWCQQTAEGRHKVHTSCTLAPHSCCGTVDMHRHRKCAWLATGPCR